ncbi:hypothetical protein [Nostoc sp. 'Peltigera malacea cyanobiont' DB3992]|uniref:hypothetical protein n=1 Tax=Nostoc sp. 'Peltigera malacea cyanobiont' DB3992 TaxID=1206980 RepID=UPI00211E509F|nr:hypothetical protein [Nostoc sp. 'Peltigera malacea cyanobiont' DB3992]
MSTTGCSVSPIKNSERKHQKERSLVTKQYTCYAPKIKECDGVPRLLHRTLKLVNAHLCLLKGK